MNAKSNYSHLALSLRRRAITGAHAIGEVVRAALVDGVPIDDVVSVADQAFAGQIGDWTPAFAGQSAPTREDFAQGALDLILDGHGVPSEDPRLAAALRRVPDLADRIAAARARMY